METVRQFLKKLNLELPCDPAIPLPDIDPKELKAETCTPIFIAALFPVARGRNSPRIYQQMSG